MNATKALKKLIKVKSKDLFDHVESCVKTTIANNGIKRVEIYLKDFDSSYDKENFPNIRNYYYLKGFKADLKGNILTISL